jgi:hypothetical protein
MMKGAIDMKNAKTIEKILFLVTVTAAFVLVAGSLDSSTYGNQQLKRPWLEQFENGPVSIHFVTPPVAKSRIVNARLISVEENGLVLRLPEDRNKFFPYANIVSVDPK